MPVKHHSKAGKAPPQRIVTFPTNAPLNDPEAACMSELLRSSTPLLGSPTLLALQRTLGNRATGLLVSRSSLIQRGGGPSTLRGGQQKDAKESGKGKKQQERSQIPVPANAVAIRDGKYAVVTGTYPRLVVVYEESSIAFSVSEDEGCLWIDGVASDSKDIGTGLGSVNWYCLAKNTSMRYIGAPNCDQGAMLYVWGPLGMQQRDDLPLSEGEGMGPLDMKGPRATIMANARAMAEKKGWKFLV